MSAREAGDGWESWRWLPKPAPDGEAGNFVRVRVWEWSTGKLNITLCRIGRLHVALLVSVLGMLDACQGVTCSLFALVVCKCVCACAFQCLCLCLCLCVGAFVSVSVIVIVMHILSACMLVV